MKIKLNNEIISLPEGVTTISRLLSWRHINTQGTAIAINDKLIRKDAWEDTVLTDDADITVISAAFGG